MLNIKSIEGLKHYLKLIDNFSIKWGLGVEKVEK